MNINALINTVLNESTINFSDYDLGKKFDHYNTTLFNGEIPKIPVYWAKLKGVGGITVAKVKKPSNGRGGYNRYHGVTLIEGSLEIKISNILKRSEDDLNGIIIHEMIHAYFISKHMFDVNHGYKFVEMVNKLSKMVGFSIPLTDEMTNVDLVDDSIIKPVGVIILSKTNGTQSFALVSPKLLQSAEFLESLKIYSYRLDMTKIDAYTIKSKNWHTVSLIFPIQRLTSDSIRRGKMKLYKMDDSNTVVSVSNLFIDLKEKGELLKTHKRHEI